MYYEMPRRILKPVALIMMSVIFAGTVLQGCQNASQDSVEKHPHHTNKHETMEHDAAHAMDRLPIENRLAFMRGHVEAGLALYRAGEPDMAAPHLLHPVSETHQAERKGLDSLGFQGELFETVSKALESGQPASEIEPQLRAAEANLKLVSQKAGGDPVSIIRFLMETVIAEYSVAITDNRVSDPGEYQDAYGFTIVAMEQAATLKSPHKETTLAALNTLLGFWPESAPIPPQNPKSIDAVTAQVETVLSVLPQ